MSTILLIIVLLVVGRAMIKHTWAGRTIWLLFKTLGEIFKFLSYSVLWVNKSLKKMNSKMRHEVQTHSAHDNKVIDLKQRKQVR
jgi:hypothetical protein